MFEFFDPHGELRIDHGNLPHWYQPGATYFITFRTEDSIPHQVMEDWLERRSEWLLHNGVNPHSAQWQVELRSTPILLQQEFHRRCSQEFLDFLDRGSGECVLRKPEVARHVASAVAHFDGTRYHLSDFVIMPNHVHVLVGLISPNEIEAVCYSWKKYSATQINRCLARRGRFWQEESFDHLVRSAEEFERISQYIAENPSNAKLRAGEFILYRRPR